MIYISEYSLTAAHRRMMITVKIVVGTVDMLNIWSQLFQRFIRVCENDLRQATSSEIVNWPAFCQL